MQTRRSFIELLPLVGLTAALAACGDKSATQAAAPAPVAPPAPAPLPAPEPSAAPAPVAAATPTKLDPTAANAVALGFVLDAKTTQNAKHTAGADCSNCALYGGKPGSPDGPCPIFGGQLVPTGGWCEAYTKKT